MQSLKFRLNIVRNNKQIMPIIKLITFKKKQIFDNNKLTKFKSR